MCSRVAAQFEIAPSLLMAGKITIKLDKETAFAFLSRFGHRGTLSIRDATEKAALVDLCEALDNELVETYRDDYQRFVERTKND
jgi:hypothetical protein